MEIQHLKLLAKRIRVLLAEQHIAVSHGQSLDLSAALVGLRNWPEVMSFPDRVAAAQLNRSAAGRLAYRINSRHGIDLAPTNLLEQLAGSSDRAVFSPQIWPTGPAAGVYITESQAAVEALIASYQSESDGAVIYAEQVGSNFQGIINLGEYGLWSDGLDRVPSGTLLVVGPLELNQQSWNESRDRLRMACIHALDSGHRVAVLISTPSSETLPWDIATLISPTKPEDADDLGDALRGVITDDGILETLQFARSTLPSPRTSSATHPLEVLSAQGAEVLQQALAQRSKGVLILSSGEITEHRAIELVAAAVTLTESYGPVARIMPRRRSTPEKDFLVPPVVRELPFLPSIESAYALGYRRMVVDGGYTEGELFEKYGDEVLFIVGAYGADVCTAYWDGRRSGTFESAELLSKVITILALLTIPLRHGAISVLDVYTAENLQRELPNDWDAIEKFLLERRRLRCEDQLTQLLDDRVATPGQIKKAFGRRSDFLDNFFAVRKQTAVA